MALESIKFLLGHCRTWAQPFWERLYKAGVRGMNFGMADLQTSGEVCALLYIKRSLGPQNSRIVLCDGGANKGAYSLLLSSLFGQDATIHAFEPLPSTFASLEAVVNSSSNVNCYRFGLGSKSEKLALYFDGAGSTIASIYPLRKDHPWKIENLLEVEIRTFDEFCSEFQIKHVHLLKLDIEGHELDALKGAANMLAQGAIEFIQWEFGPRSIDARSYFRDFWLLLHEDYRIFRIISDGLVSIPRYDEYLELFGATSNYLAERKRVGQLCVG